MGMMNVPQLYKRCINEYKYVPLNDFKVVSGEHKSQGLRAGRPNDQTGTHERALLRRSKTQAVVAQKKKKTAVCR